MATTKKKTATGKKTATASKGLVKVSKNSAKAAIKSTTAKKATSPKSAISKAAAKAGARKKEVVSKATIKKTGSVKVSKSKAKETEIKTPKKLKTKITTQKKETKKAKTVVAKKTTPLKKSSRHLDIKDPIDHKPTHHQELLKKAVKVKKAEEKKKVEKEKAFVMPVTHTTKSREYKPNFEKSILDAPEPRVTGPVLRYSDAELQEFRELITRKLESAKRELNYLQGLITRKGQMGGDESENRYMTMEDGSLSMEREQLAQMASRQITFIDHLEKALIRIENKTYGICRVTGKLIDKARLRAVPHATLSIEAKMGIAK